jgi:hypothetical protein
VDQPLRLKTNMSLGCTQLDAHLRIARNETQL